MVLLPGDCDSALRIYYGRPGNKYDKAQAAKFKDRHDGDGQFLS